MCLHGPYTTAAAQDSYLYVQQQLLDYGTRQEDISLVSKVNNDTSPKPLNK